MTKMTRRRAGRVAPPAPATMAVLGALILATLALTACSNPAADAPPGEGEDNASPTSGQQRAATPTTDPRGGAFEYPPVVTITSDDAEAEMRFTLDGTEPTGNSTRYEEPFELPPSRDPVVLSVRAYVDEMDPSDVVTQEYDIERGPILTVEVLGDGTVTPDPDVGRYRWDESVTLVATADDGHTFTGWSGDLTGSESTQTLVMETDRSATAAFEEDQSTTGLAHALRGGVVLNEFLADPTGPDASVDTDGSGGAGETDEFVELYNASEDAVDLAGLQLWDAGYGNWFSFPEDSLVEAGGYAVVVAGVQDGGSPPAVPDGSVAFEAGRGGGVLNNGGDNVVILDPEADAYLQVLYNGADADSPATDYSGFPATASVVDAVEDWGRDVDGNSLGRLPDGTGDPMVHGEGANGAASPGGPNGPEPAAASGNASTSP
ncbi:MAG: lamin tail domain-containing protein [Spirochaetaceae bacterium]